MAPLMMLESADEGDDFILTLSDREPDQLSSEDEDAPQRPKFNAQATQNKKRKHGKIDSGSVFPSANGGKSQKKQKTNSKTPAKEVVRDADRGLEEEDALNSDFEFQIGQAEELLEDADNWMLEDSGSRPADAALKKGVDLDAIIAKRKNGGDLRKSPADESDGSTNSEEDDHLDDEEVPGMEDDAGMNGDDEDEEMLADDAFGMGASLENDADGASQISSGEEQGSDTEAVADEMPELDEPEDSDEELDAAEKQRRAEFFAPEVAVPLQNSRSKKDPASSFQSMQLSRPIMRGLAAMNFAAPTPIQLKTIPNALAGKDVVGGAVTGSGKTAAFMIPILERLLYRPKKVPTTRVAILMPTRELSVQCFNVAKKLASFTDITFCLLMGGSSLREQEIALKQRPDVVIATPGRFIDHMRNTASFTIDTLEILVLDEADKMLDDGFADELDEILRTIPKSRQTMLFSATMTDQLDQLIRAGLRRPVRLMVDPKKQTVGTLVQEFVRLRPGREDKRLAYLLHLCSNVFKEHVIVFFRQKKEAHRARIVFGLHDIKAAELHGSMSQEQRLTALSSFRNNQCTHLLATDVASRGLDIPHVSVVINYEAPQSHEIYLHRVGRTARAGRNGRACTIAAESDRKIVKQAVKASKKSGAKIVSRFVEPDTADDWATKIVDMGESIKEILEDEKQEKALNQADMSIRKKENTINHKDEILSRPKRTWFETEKEKLQAKKAGQEELNGRVGLGKTSKSKKLSGKEMKELENRSERKESRSWKKGKGDAAGKPQKGGSSKAKKQGKAKSKRMKGR